MEGQPNFWKIGSWWGPECGSVLNLFIDYGCVFFGGCWDGYIGNWQAVRPGDYFIIADRSRPVAIAKSYTGFQTYEDSGLRFSQNDQEAFGYDEVCFCRVQLFLLTEEERALNWGIDIRRRFCAYNGDRDKRDKVVECWEKAYKSRDKGAFSIKSHTWGLLDSEHKDLDVEGAVFARNKRYHIPIYQRPYSWGEGELQRLMEDLSQAVKNDEPVFMGTMQLSEPIPLNVEGTLKAYELIDGQQRVTTFMILLTELQKRLDKDLGIDFQHALRTVVNRGEAQRNLNEYWDVKSMEALEGKGPYVRNAMIIDKLLDECFEGQEGKASLEKLWEFLGQNIRFVVIETRAGLSKTLKIFNTINTAGLDLGVEDLFKVRFYEYRRMCGDSEDVFERISDIYASIDKYNREHPDRGLCMATLMQTYQRILVARHKLSTELFNMPFERFFDRLFDTALGVHRWRGFESILEKKLTVEDFAKLLKCFETKYELEDKDWNLRIMDRLIWDTRYGYAHDFNVIALFFEQVTEATFFEFTAKFFKVLVPHSLFYAKRVYRVNSELLNILHEIPDKEGVEILKRYFNEGKFAEEDTEALLKKACVYEIAWYPKWKMLLCRLAEYLQHDQKDQNLFNLLFETPVDIEHIQAYTDDTDPEGVWNEWGEELHRLGNLAMLEQDLNRSIQNNPEKKQEAYEDSKFLCIQQLKDKVGENWKKEDAKERRTEITNQICDFILEREKYKTDYIPIEK